VSRSSLSDSPECSFRARPLAGQPLCNIENDHEHSFHIAEKMTTIVSMDARTTTTCIPASMTIRTEFNRDGMCDRVVERSRAGSEVVYAVIRERLIQHNSLNTVIGWWDEHCRAQQGWE
jgi:hypothetical protein